MAFNVCTNRYTLHMQNSNEDITTDPLTMISVWALKHTEAQHQPQTHTHTMSNRTKTTSTPDNEMICRRRRKKSDF